MGVPGGDEGTSPGRITSLVRGEREAGVPELRRALLLVEMNCLPVPPALPPALQARVLRGLCCVVGEVCCCRRPRGWHPSCDNASLALYPSPSGLKQWSRVEANASCQVQVCLSVSRASRNPLVVGGSVPSLLPSQPSLAGPDSGAL